MQIFAKNCKNQLQQFATNCNYLKLQIEQIKKSVPQSVPQETRTPCKVLTYKALRLLVAERTGPEPT